MAFSVHFLLLPVLLVVCLNFVSQSNGFSHAGREFYLGFFRNRLFARNPRAYLLITAADPTGDPVPFTVEVPLQGFRVDGVAFPGRHTRVDLQRSVLVSRVSAPTRTVVVQANPVSTGDLVVVGMNEDEASTDAYLGLPVVRYATNVYEYVAFSTKRTSLIAEGNSVVLMVASEDNTEVTVTPTQESFMPVARPRLLRNEPRSFTLNRLRMMQLYSENDLTGTHIRSNKPLSVFVGHECGNVPFNVSACDHLLEQVAPTDSWGQTYYTSPLPERTGGDLFKLVASKDNTNVKMTCVDKRSSFSREQDFKVGQFQVLTLVVGSSEFCRFQGSLPISLVQYSQGHAVDNSLFTDPFITTVQPYEQYINQYPVIAIKGDLLQFRSFANLLIPSHFYQPDNITIDGVSLSNYGRSNEMIVTEIDFDSQDMVAVTISLTTGSHFFKHTSPFAIFSVSIYGYSDQMAYGYPGGFGLNAISVSNFSLKVDMQQIREDRGPLPVGILREGLIGIPATVIVATQEVAGGARSVSDFVPLREEVRFAPGEMHRRVNVVVNDNSLRNDRRRPFKVVLLVATPQPGVAVRREDSSVEVNIVDDDTPVVIELQSKEYVVSEGDLKVLRVGVKRTGIIADDIVLDLEIIQKVFFGQEGNAEKPKILSAKFNASNTNETEIVFVEIPFEDDEVVNGNRKFLLRLIFPDKIKEDPRIRKGSAQSADISVLDDDAVEFEFANRTAVAVEGQGRVAICVNKKGNTTLRLTVGVISSFNTARDGSDFMSVNVNLVFEAAEEQKCLSVTLTDDNFAEAVETFTLGLVNQNGENARVGNDSVLTVEIMDDDILSVGFKDEVVIGNEGGPARVCVTVSGSSQVDMLFTIATVGGNASYPQDGMINLPGPPNGKLLIIPSRSTQRCFDVALSSDGNAETSEFFIFSLSPNNLMGSPVIITRNTTTLIIRDADVLIFEVTGQDSAKEGETTTICVRKSGDTEMSVSVIVGVLFTSDPNYLPSNITFQVDFAPGQREVCTQFGLPNDTVAAGAILLEFGLIEFLGDVGHILTTGRFFVNVADDESISVGFGAVQYTVAEDGGSATVCLRVPGEFRNQETVRLSVAVESFNTNATAGDDYSSLSASISLRLRLGDGEREQCFQIPITDDSVYEPDEVIGLVVQLGPESPQVTLQPRRTSVVILDNDNVTLRMKAPTANFSESDDIIRVCIVKDGVSTVPVVVDATAQSGTAVINEDFGFQPIAVLFPPGNKEQCIFFPILNNFVIEPVESFFVEIALPSPNRERVLLGFPQRTEVFITDDDVAEVQFEELDMNSVFEFRGFDQEVCLLKEGLTLETISVTIEAVRVDLPTSASPLTDLSSPQITFTFAPNISRVCRPLHIIDDDVLESNELLSLVVLPPSDPASAQFSVGEIARLNITILDDDMVTISFEPSSLSIIEGESPRPVCITMEGTVTIEVNFTLHDMEISANEGSDYTGFENVVFTFGPTLSRQCFAVAVTDDSEEEAAEMFLLIGEYRPGAGAQQSSATLMADILDDDSLTFSVELTEEVLESVGTVQACVRKEGNTAKDFTFTITTSGTAQNNIDYTLGQSALAIPVNSTKECFIITVISDDILERDETVNVALSGPAELSANLTILNDDSAEIYLQRSEYRVNESAGEVFVDITINGTIAVPLPFMLILTPGTASQNDFVTANVSKPVALFSNQERVSVPIIDDSRPEGDETFRVSLVLPPASAAAGLILPLSNRDAVVTIQDDDTINVGFSRLIFNVSEGDGSVVVQVRSDVAADNDLSVGITVSEGTAKFLTDVLEETAVVVILAGETSGESRITVVNDNTAEETEEVTLSLSIMTPQSELLTELDQMSEARVRIFDDDTPVLQFDRSVYVVSESDSLVALTLESSNPAVYDISLAFGVSSVSASEGTDFTVASSSPLTLQSGMTNASVVIAIIGNSIFQGNKTIQVTLNSVSGEVTNLPTPPSLGTRSSASVIVLEDDQRIFVSFEQSAYTTGEGIGHVVVCAELEGEGRPQQPLSIPLLVHNGSAGAGVDFTVSDPLSVTFAVGETQSCLTVNITDDEDEETTENFELSINFDQAGGIPLGVVPGSTVRTVVRISDNDDPLRQCIVTGRQVAPFQRLTASSLLSYPTNQPCEHVLVSSCSSSSSSSTPSSSSGSLRVHADFEGEGLGVVLIRIGATTVNLFANGSFEVANQTSVGGPQDGVALSVLSSSDSVAVSTGDFTVTRTFGNQTTDEVNVTLSTGSTRLCGLCGDRGVVLRTRSLRVLEANPSPERLASFVKSWRLEEEDSAIPVTRQECATMRNDSMILDPLLTVPIYIHDAPRKQMFRKAALCFEIRGHSDSIYNLISDTCVSVNGEFVQMPAPRQHLNSLGSVGVVAVDDAGECVSIAVRHEGECVATVNGQPIETGFSRNGVSVTKQGRDMLIKVPNCDHVDLSMWVMCQQVEGLNMIKYVITRSLNMHPTSHGLIGQFWNVPVVINRTSDENLATPDAQMFKVSVQPPHSPQRSFYAEYSSRTWAGTRTPCLYAGTSQGHAHSADRNSLIEGHLSQYHVPSLLSTEFAYSRFESSQCAHAGPAP